MPDFERTTTPVAPVITTAEAKLHLRQDLSVDDSLIDDMIAAATREIEDYAQIALITQSVTVTFTGPFTAGRIRLPIGPVASGATATITMVEPNGDETALASGFFSLRTGKAPAIWLGDGDTALPSLLGEADTELRVEYDAGFGSTADDVPSDLRHAVLDQAAMLYTHRATWRQLRQTPSMSAHAIRVAQRYRRSSV